MAKRFIAILLSFSLALPTGAWAGDDDLSLYDAIKPYSQNTLPNLHDENQLQLFRFYILSRYKGTTYEATEKKLRDVRDFMDAHPGVSKLSPPPVRWTEAREVRAVTPKLHALVGELVRANSGWKAMLLQPFANVGDWLKFKVGGKNPIDRTIFEAIFHDDLKELIYRRDKLDSRNWQPSANRRRKSA